VYAPGASEGEKQMFSGWSDLVQALTFTLDPPIVGDKIVFEAAGSIVGVSCTIWGFEEVNLYTNVIDSGRAVPCVAMDNADGKWSDETCTDTKQHVCMQAGYDGYEKYLGCDATSMLCALASVEGKPGKDLDVASFVAKQVTFEGSTPVNGQNAFTIHPSFARGTAYNRDFFIGQVNGQLRLITPCQDDSWTHILPSLCVKTFDAKRTWFKAKMECEDLGASLVTISNKNENDLVKTTIGLCPTGWTKSGGYCYKSFSTEKSYDDAQTQCDAEGATLATIPSSTENAVVFGMVTSMNKAVWIGFNDKKMV
jgi:hypothetical protein